MKKLCLVLFAFSMFIGCEKNEVEIPEIPDATILGRWVIKGDTDLNVRYEYTANKRFTIYKQDNGTYPTLAEFQAENPDLTGNDWEYSGDTIVVDLNFGNYSKLVPTFKCDNYVVDWTGEDGEQWGTYYRDGYDIAECTE